MNFPKPIIISQEIRELNRDGAKLVKWGKMFNGSLHLFIRNSTSKFISKQYNYSRVLHIRNHFLTLRPKPLSCRGTCRYQGRVITKKPNYPKLAETCQNEPKPVLPTLKPAETSPSHSQMTETSSYSSKAADEICLLYSW